MRGFQHFVLQSLEVNDLNERAKQAFRFFTAGPDMWETDQQRPGWLSLLSCLIDVDDQRRLSFPDTWNVILPDQARALGQVTRQRCIQRPGRVDFTIRRQQLNMVRCERGIVCKELFLCSSQSRKYIMNWDSCASNHWRTAKNIIGRDDDLMGFIPDFYHLIPPALVRLYPYHVSAIGTFSTQLVVNFRRIYPALLRDSFPLMLPI